MRLITEGSLDLDEVLSRPLFAHLSTASPHGPRSSPVWFLWEEGAVWILANRAHDTFPARIEAEPRCALSVVDLELHRGRVHHVGMRGTATVVPFDPLRARHKLRRYLGPDESRWDRQLFTLDPRKPLVFIRFEPETVVLRDQSYAGSL